MLKKEVKEIIAKSEKAGWVMEPEAKRIFSLYGLKIPKYAVATEARQAISIAGSIGYPVVAKIVSPAIIHKSDVKGVVLGIISDQVLTRLWNASGNSMVLPVC
jgi:acetate---CoA ligase (ADP-forming) subunit beta